MSARKDWYSEDGTFIGPWWLRWAFLVVSVAGPLVWLFIFGSLSVEIIMTWVIILAGLNLLRAPR